jgi:hypothetical protein
VCSAQFGAAIEFLTGAAANAQIFDIFNHFGRILPLAKS